MKELYYTSKRNRDECWRAFERWPDRSMRGLPTPLADVIRYLQVCATRVGPAHVREIFRTIRKRNGEAGYAHLEGTELRDRVKHIAKHATASNAMLELFTSDELRILIAAIGRATVLALRDVAIILLVASGWLKREEIILLQCNDIDPIPTKGLDIRTRGRFPRLVSIPQLDGRPELCPVRALNRYLRSTGVREGVVFRSESGKPLTALKTLQDMFRRRLVRAGLYRSGLGLRNVRETSLLTAVMEATDRYDLEAQAGWRSIHTYERVLERAKLYFPALDEDTLPF